MRNLRHSVVLMGLPAALLILSACGPAAPTPTAAPLPTFTPLPPAGEDGTYPVRYFHTELPVSLEPPPGWQVSEETGGMALADNTDGETGAQILLTAEQPEVSASASDANLLAVPTVHGADVVIDEATEFTFETGEPGYLRRGVAADSSTWAVATLATQEVVLNLTLSSTDPAGEGREAPSPAANASDPGARVRPAAGGLRRHTAPASPR